MGEDSTRKEGMGGGLAGDGLGHQLQTGQELVVAKLKATLEVDRTIFKTHPMKEVDRF